MQPPPDGWLHALNANRIRICHISNLYDLLRACWQRHTKIDIEDPGLLQ